MHSKILVSKSDFSLDAELELIRSQNLNTGALAFFVGMVREDQAVRSLLLEHYPGMTEKSLQKIAGESGERWKLDAVTIIHRVGQLEPGDRIVLVITASTHRKDAFDACEFIMDYLKTRAPFWKKELTENGDSWVQARESDQLAAQNWGRDDIKP